VLEVVLGKAPAAGVDVRAGGDGRTPGPGWRKFTAYRQTGPGGLPLALRLSEGLASLANIPQVCGRRAVKNAVNSKLRTGLAQTLKETAPAAE